MILRETLSFLSVDHVQDKDYPWIRPYLEKIDRLEGICEEKILEECILPQEELIMYVFTKLVIESCKPLLLNTEGLERILGDELKRERTLREMVRGSKST